MRLKSFLKSGHPKTLFAAFLYFDISFMVWVLMGVLGVYIAQDLHLTASQKGLLAAMPLLGGSLVRVPMGLLVDMLGPKKTGIVAQILVMIPLFGTWLFAGGLSDLLVLGLLLGIAGGSFAVALPLASRWYPPQHQGMAMGIAGAGNSGTVLASLFAPRLAAVVGWHQVFGLALIPVTLTLLAFTLLAKEYPHAAKSGKKPANFFAVLRHADTWWFCLFYSITFGGFVGLASFLGIFFHDQYGMSKVAAGTLTAGCVFLGSFVRPIGGFLADKYGGITVLSLVFGLVAALAIAVGTLPVLPMAAVLLMSVTSLLGMGNGAVFQLVPQRFHKEIGTITGIVGAAGGVGGFFLPTFLGYFKGALGSYGVGFVIFGIASAAALVVLRLVQRQWSLTWLLPQVPAMSPAEIPAGQVS